MEYFSARLPSTFKANEAYLQKEQEKFETLVLGSSQMQGAVNPEWLNSPTLNLASGDQHHDTDFKLLKGIHESLPKLKTVVLEVSYSHFELPHNGKDFWKNTLYLKYYGVNAFERKTYFKDRLLYVSNPRFFSERIDAHFIQKKAQVAYNYFGFNTKNYEGQFKNLNYNEKRIAQVPNFKINTEPNPFIFKTNTALFYEMLDFLAEKNYRVIIAKVPMYKTYHSKRNTNILRRRDSVLSDVLLKYPNCRLLDMEDNTTLFNVKDYWNQSHLNPDGAKKFTAQLNGLLQTSP
ncbi:MAG: hypothetical protein AAF489_00875 [Bacteroidota bacterium]